MGAKEFLQLVCLLRNRCQSDNEEGENENDQQSDSDSNDSNNVHHHHHHHHQLVLLHYEALLATCEYAARVTVGVREPRSALLGAASTDHFFTSAFSELAGGADSNRRRLPFAETEIVKVDELTPTGVSVSLFELPSLFAPFLLQLASCLLLSPSLTCSVSEAHRIFLATLADSGGGGGGEEQEEDDRSEAEQQQPPSVSVSDFLERYPLCLVSNNTNYSAASLANATLTMDERIVYFCFAAQLTCTPLLFHTLFDHYASEEQEEAPRRATNNSNNDSGDPTAEGPADEGAHRRTQQRNGLHVIPIKHSTCIVKIVLENAQLRELASEGVKSEALDFLLHEARQAGDVVTSAVDERLAQLERDLDTANGLDEEFPKVLATVRLVNELRRRASVAHEAGDAQLSHDLSVRTLRYYDALLARDDLAVYSALVPEDALREGIAVVKRHTAMARWRLADLCGSSEAEQRRKHEMLVESKVLIEESLEFFTHNTHRDEELIALCCNELSFVVGDLGDHVEALRLLQRTLEIQNRMLGEQDSRVASTLANMSHEARLSGNAAQALLYAQRALSIDVSNFGEGHAENFYATRQVAHSFAALGDKAQARRFYEEAVALAMAHVPPRNDLCLEVHKSLSEL